MQFLEYPMFPNFIVEFKRVYLQNNLIRCKNLGYSGRMLPVILNNSRGTSDS
jgi:hypothetical protein